MDATVFVIIPKITVDVCKCRNPIPEKFEFEDITPIIQIFLEDNSDNYYDMDLLKEKAICDYMHILDQLECGILPDLEILLEEISLINIYE